ncbi:hypothetical protein RhiirC2_858123, partial [Rhizophagus irregularis]
LIYSYVFHPNQLYPSGNLLNLFLEHFFHVSTRLENKVPVSIPKLLVQDQDLYKTLTCLDRYHNGDSK